jgi:ankyrin repeat protein
VGLTRFLKGHPMPTSKKPRKGKGGRAAPPKKSVTDQLLEDMSFAMNTGDLDAFDHAQTALRQHAVRDPALNADFFAHIAVMRAELVGSIAIAEDVQAALWVGDMKRVQELEEASLPLTGAPDDDDDPDLEDYFAATDPYADLAQGKPGAVRALLASGLDLQTLAGPEERPALFAAVEAPGRNAETLQHLLDAGADAGDILDDGSSILSWALMYDHYETVTPDSEKALFDLLIANGAEANGHSEDFGTNLIAAIVMGGLPQVAALLQAGADMAVVAPDDFQLSDLAGATPLMLAAPKPDVVRLLLAHGASPTERDANGRTPREVIHDAATLARDRIKDDWSRAHADALDQSLALIRAALN